MSSSTPGGKLKFIAQVKHLSPPSSAKENSWATVVGIGRLNVFVSGEAGRVTVLLGGGVGISPRALKVRTVLPPSLGLFLGFFEELTRAASVGVGPVPMALLFWFNLFLKPDNIPTAWGIPLLAIVETKNNVLANKKKESD